jgi:drug/metabolite transporter (DMT)-like permease
MLFLGLFLLKVRFSGEGFKFMGNAGFRDALISALISGITFDVIESTYIATGPSIILFTEEGSILFFSVMHILLARYLGQIKRKKGQAASIRWSKEQMRQHWKNYAWTIAIIGILSSASLIFRIVSNGAPLPMATFILSFSVLVTIMAAQIIYNEKLILQQKIAIFLLIGGIIVISYIGDNQLHNWEMFRQD